MSDWGATHSTVPAALGGLDQQMPDSSFFGAALAAAVAAGQVPESRIDDMVTRMLVPMYAINIFANGNSPDRNTSSPAGSPAHNALALQLAQKSITLLTNKGVLPVAPEEIKSVAIFGDQVRDNHRCMRDDAAASAPAACVVYILTSVPKLPALALNSCRIRCTEAGPGRL
jgi:beta-glucosidase-like glycosyl hydrolase